MAGCTTKDDDIGFSSCGMGDLEKRRSITVPLSGCLDRPAEILNFSCQL